VFTKDGVFRSMWGIEGADPGEFKSPLSVSYSDGKIYVTEKGGVDSNTSSVLAPKIQIYQ
ncbi:MAG: hypothetical protein ACI9BD_000203, partial [Candidatus Marinamargulisbacteria bacterium]